MLADSRTAPMKTPEYESAQAAFCDGSVVTAPREHLQRYLLAISRNATFDDAIQSRDNVQVVTLNHLILQRHIDELERRSKWLQWLVVVLTVASLFGTVVQSWLAYRAEARAEGELRIGSAQQQGHLPVTKSLPAVSSNAGSAAASPTSSPKQSK
ncbi:MAG: hypothetical protein LW847_02395 [Burkholderiales bacterium]|jgi:hypothetical protein|nr:hypothetical protein [Burkholderiales bacterium]